VRAEAEEVLSIAGSELPGLNGRIGYLEGTGDDLGTDYPSYPSLPAELKRAAAKQYAEGAPAAVIVPLLAGPEASVLRQIRQAVAECSAAAELTDVLGPHPLLAEALHVRLSEAGLARADRARLFTVATAADGIILATVGGEEAVQAAGVTGLLLAARLAVPVLAAGIDVEGTVAHTAEQLRSSGSGRLALAPCLIGPELGDGLLAAAAEEAGCAAAKALGSYPAVGRLVLNRYTTALGIAPQQPQGAPVR
jgi:sirohydrochlorin ferrochelatase